jgi:hypothetical protein
VARENHHPVSMVRRYLPGYQTHLRLRFCYMALCPLVK